MRLQVLEKDETSEKIHLPTGTHVIADLWACQVSVIIPMILKMFCVKMPERASATVLNITIEKFPEIEVNGKMVQGMTGTVILSESHICFFYTWPEGCFVARDIFTCGTNALPEKGLEVLLEHFKPQRTTFDMAVAEAAKCNALESENNN